MTPVPVAVAAPAPGPADAPAPQAAQVATPLSSAEATSFLASIEFLFTGSEPIQKDVANPSPITESGAALIHGVVTATNGQAIGGVRIAILAHGQYGYTDTAGDGSFAMAVNGGQTLTLTFERKGYIPVQKTLTVPVNQSTTVPAVALSGYQGEADEVNLAASSKVQVAQGEVESDADGTRQVTLVFNPGTEATMHLPDGSSRPLSDLHVRATEFTVGEYGPAAMPGTLPPTAAYTYATAFTVDEAVEAGATSVTFNKPVVSYVENFLGFPVGAEVPSGSYEPESGQWGASSNGLVVKILSISGGTATLAVDSSGQPASSAELSELGISSEELKTLAADYQPGQTLWRVPLMHFSSWDFNFLPEDEQPEPPPPPTDENPPQDESCEAPGGSTVLCDSQAVAEDVPVAGTPFSLHYQSDRVAGYHGADAIQVPITAAGEVPRSVDHIEVEVDILGRTYHHAYCMPGGEDCPAGSEQVASGHGAGLEYDVLWDRHDGFGRVVTGSTTADVTVTYWVGAVYQCTMYTVGGGGYSEFGSTYAYGSGCGAQARELEGVSDTEQVQVGPSANVSGVGLGEWSLNALDSYDPSSGVLHSGDGADTSVQTVAPELEALTGSETYEEVQDGKLASEGGFEEPEGILELPSGAILVAECGANKVREIEPDGTVSTFAGTGTPGRTGDGGPAKQATLACPSSLALAPDGSVYIADEYGNLEGGYEEYGGSIRRVSPTGTITTVAGGGQNIAQDAVGKAATSIELYYPGQIALGPDGSLYIADRGTSLIERVDTSGILSLVNYNPNTYSTEGVEDPEGLAVTTNGEVIVSDGYAGKLVRIGPGGATVIAGNGTSGHGGDGGPATSAAIEEAGTIALGQNGDIFFAEAGYSARVRMISPTGIITTVAGGGTDDARAGGIPATAAQLYWIQGLAASTDGSLLISDADQGLFRMKTSLAGLSEGHFLVPTAGGSRVDEFNGGGREEAVYDSTTGVKLLHFSYDGAGRLTAIEDRHGNLTTIERNGAGEPLAIVAPGGQRTALTLGAGGRLEGIADPDGNTWSAGYEAQSGQLTSFTDPKGGKSSMTYDTLGRLRSDTDQAGGKTTLSSSFGESPDGASEKIVTVEGPEGLTTTYGDSVDWWGESTRTITEPDGGKTTYRNYSDGYSEIDLADGTVEYSREIGDPRFGLADPILEYLDVYSPDDGNGISLSEERTVKLSNPNDPLSVSKITDSFNEYGRGTSTTTYEAANHTVTSTSPEGRVQTVTYDSQDDPIRETSPFSSLPTEYSWNPLGELTGETWGERSRGYGYDGGGNLKTLTDEGGNKIEYTREADGLATKLKDQLGFSWSFGHDAGGELTSLSLPSGGSDQFGYTPVGNLQSLRVSGQTSGRSSEYGLRRQVKKATLPEGSIEYHYDSVGRLTGETSAAGGNIAITYATGSYEPQTLSREEAGENTDTITATHDGGNLTGQVFTEAHKGTTKAQYAYGYRYSDGKLAEMQLEAAGKLHETYFAHDKDGLLERIGPFSISRDAASGLPTRVYNGAFEETLAHNAYGEENERAVAVAGHQIYKEAVTHDTHTGRIKSRTETIGGTGSTYGYEYDKDGRLTAVTGASPQSYSYDSDGNLTQRKSSALEGSLTYDGQGRETELGSTKYVYGEDGQMTKRGSDTFTYGLRSGELLSATVGGKTVTYDYDALGHRVARREGSGEPERFLYGDPEAPYLLTASIAPDGTLTTYEYEGAGRLVSFERGGKTYYVATDQLGSPRVISNAEGTILKTVSYDAYGEITSETEPSLQIPVGYAGGLYDPLTKLVHFYERDYEPASGRFTERDPKVLQGGLNMYAYVGDDPVDYTDPWGTSREREGLERAQREQAEAAQEAAAAEAAANAPPPPSRWERAKEWIEEKVFTPASEKVTNIINACKVILDPNAGPKDVVKPLKEFTKWASEQGPISLTPAEAIEQTIDKGVPLMESAGTHSTANGGPGMDTSGNIYGGGQ